MEEMPMKRTLSSTDISRYYRQNSSARLANVDTTATCDNLAFAMKNSIIVLRPIHCADLPLIDSIRPIDTADDEDPLSDSDTTINH